MQGKGEETMQEISSEIMQDASEETMQEISSETMQGSGGVTMQEISRQTMLEAIRKKNEKSARFGLVLSEGEMRRLADRRWEALKEQQRVEFGEGILPVIMEVFCDSSYIRQEEYADTLERLQEIFYLYKNETMDICTDDELLDYMKEAFDGACHGLLELLEGTALEEFARSIRAKQRNFFDGYLEKRGTMNDL